MARIRLEDLVDSPASARTRSDLDGIWRNTLGSEMSLQVTEDHLIRGWFRPAGGHDAETRRHHLRGFTEGSAFAFCVDFGEHGSVASWTGHLIDDERGERLEALWQLARERQPDDGGSPAWGALLTGANEFVRVE
jgi:hypothetical protein